MSYWKEYIRQRFVAQRHLLTILNNLNDEEINWKNSTYPQFDPETEAEFEVNWGVRKDPDMRIGSLDRDAIPIEIVLPRGAHVIIIYLPTAPNATKVPASVVKQGMKSIFESGEGGSTIQLRESSNLIMLSMVKLDGAGRNEMIRNANALSKHTIRHFTLKELQFDPTKHAAQPWSMRRITEAEKAALITQQIGLEIGRITLAKDYDKKMATLQDKEKAQYAMDVTREIINTIPTINTEDPWVKWHWFKVDDILAIERRTELNPFTWKRVIPVEAVPEKTAKAKQVVTNK